MEHAATNTSSNYQQPSILRMIAHEMALYFAMCSVYCHCIVQLLVKSDFSFLKVKINVGRAVNTSGFLNISGLKIIFAFCS